MRLYKSLERQSYRQFEWLVVDDCSNDSTVEIIENLKKNASFDIRIIKNSENKMVSYCCNLAVKRAAGEFFLFVGHDDELTDDSLATYAKEWESIDIEDRLGLAGMMANCCDENGEMVKDVFPESPMRMSFFEMYYIYNVTGEKSFCYRTEILKENNFPCVDRYVSENTTLLGISDNYETHFFNKDLRIYRLNHENHQNLSKKLVKRILYPKGVWFSKLEDINRRSHKFLKHRPDIYFKNLVNLSRFGLHADITLKFTTSSLKFATHKGLFILFFPVGLVLYLRDRRLSRV